MCVPPEKQTDEREGQHRLEVCLNPKSTFSKKELKTCQKVPTNIYKTPLSSVVGYVLKVFKCGDK